MGKRYSVIFDTEVSGGSESDLSAVGLGAKRGADGVWRDPRDIMLDESIEVRREDDNDDAWNAEELSYGDLIHAEADLPLGEEAEDDDGLATLRLLFFPTLVQRRRNLEERLGTAKEQLKMAECIGAEKHALLARRVINGLSARLELIRVAMLGKDCPPETAPKPVPTTSLTARRKKPHHVH